MRPTDTLGGTDIARIVGLSPYGGPIDVFREKCEGYEQEQTAPMKRGLRFEPVVRQLYVDETGATIRTPHPGIVRPKAWPFAHASVDDMATRDGTDVLCEWKTASWRAARDWGTEADEVPMAYLAQTAWYLGCTGMAAADLAVLIGVDDFRVFRIVRDMELEAMLFEAGAKFHRDHILTKTPPPPDASESYGQWLQKRYPETRSLTKEATPEIEAVAQRFERARREAEVAEEKAAAARNELLTFIGDAEGVTGQQWRATYKSTKGRPAVDWEAVCQEAQVPKDVVAKYTRRTPYRVLRFTWKEQ